MAGERLGPADVRVCDVVRGLGGLLGDHYALLSLSPLGVFVVFLNLHTLWTAQGTELTTSAALLVIGLGWAFAAKSIP
jgi:hypothetical protein